jgi:hypothetical protein
VFDLKGTPERAKTIEAIICLTNQVFEWYKTQQSADPKFKDKSWRNFKKKFENAYYPTPSETRYIDDTRILSFKQERGECPVDFAARLLSVSQTLPHKEHERFTISKLLYYGGLQLGTGFSKMLMTTRMMKSLMLLKNILLIQIIWPLSREKFLV